MRAAESSFLPAGTGDRWLFGFMLEGPGRGRAPAPAEVAERLRRAAGVPGLPVDVERVGLFSSAAQIADRFREGRAFLIGDAAHRVTPRGGTGMNTAIHDGYDLGLEAGLGAARMGGRGLLDTYERERRPVAEHNVARSADPEGSRRTAGEELRIDLGARIAHHWVGAADERASTLDLPGPGLTLLTGPRDDGWRALAAALPGSPPVALRRLDELTARASGCAARAGCWCAPTPPRTPGGRAGRRRPSSCGGRPSSAPRPPRRAAARPGGGVGSAAAGIASASSPPAGPSARGGSPNEQEVHVKPVRWTTRTRRIAAVAAMAVVLALVAGRRLRGHRASPADPDVRRPTSERQITNIDVLRQQIRNYYGDPLGTRHLRAGQQLRQGGQSRRGRRASATSPSARHDHGKERRRSSSTSTTPRWPPGTTRSPATGPSTRRPTATFVTEQRFPAVPGMVDLVQKAADAGLRDLLPDRPAAPRRRPRPSATSPRTASARTPATRRRRRCSNGEDGLFTKPAVADYPDYLKTACAGEIADGSPARRSTTSRRRGRTSSRSATTSSPTSATSSATSTGGFADRTFKLPNPNYFLP